MKVVFIQEFVPSYRVPFFTGLSRVPGIDLTLLAGAGGEDEGFDAPRPAESSFRWITLPRRVVGRRGARLVILDSLLPTLRAERPEVVITTGAKSFVQNHALIAARRLGRFRLYFFQHAKDYRAMGRLRRALEWALFRWWLYPNCDGIILYTEDERRALLKRGLDSERVFYANNTIDTATVARLREELRQGEIDAVLDAFGVDKRPSVLYIGRLVAGKDVEVLPAVFEALRVRVPAAQLIVVGDGPLAPTLRRDMTGHDGVVMTGPVYDERRIACLMSACRFVFIPDCAGLSVNHAFAYGRPFVTYASPEHGPEIGYLVPGENGLILDRSKPTANTDLMGRLLTDDAWWGEMSAAAKRTAERLTMSAMVANVARAIQRGSALA